VVFLLRTLTGAARWAAVGRLLETQQARSARLARAAAATPQRLVFVCHGNIMRSAFAVAYLRQQAPALAKRVVGSGTHAKLGRAAQESALRVAPEFGVSLADHTAQPLDAVGLGADDVIICMDRFNEANVIARYPALAASVFLVGDIEAEPPVAGRDVPDPYAKGDEATRVAFRRVSAFADEWRRLLLPVGGEGQGA